MTVGRIFTKNIYLYKIIEYSSSKIKVELYCTFCIFGIFFRKPEKLGSHTGSKWWPGDPDVKDDPKWPIDPVTQWPSSMSETHTQTRKPRRDGNNSPQQSPCRLKISRVSRGPSATAGPLLRLTTDNLLSGTRRLAWQRSPVRRIMRRFVYFPLTSKRRIRHRTNEGGDIGGAITSVAWHDCV